MGKRKPPGGAADVVKITLGVSPLFCVSGSLALAAGLALFTVLAVAVFAPFG